jgi:hypothetical protein
MSNLPIKQSPFSEHEIQMLKRHILKRSPEIWKLTNVQIDDIVKCIINQIDQLYPNYGKFTLAELYDILESDLSDCQDELKEQFELQNEFQKNCNLTERQIIEYQTK